MRFHRILNAPYWPEPVAILSQTETTEVFIALELVGLETERHYTTTLPIDIWETLQPQDYEYTFDAPSQPFRLALEAERLRLAHTADPLLAANNARVHLLPHQMEAVYGVMLRQPRIRHLMAHDAGAGKTIMGGLLFKELVSRSPNLRTLIVAPAALVTQWQRELREKFLVEFEIIDRGQLREDGQVWMEATRVITSLPFARQADVQASLASVPWELVLVDEAHHMAGYEKSETLAYRLGRTLSRNTKHLVLATATPHKGDRTNFLKLLQLLDEKIYNPDIVNHRAPGQRGNPLMLRRLKEEMVDFDGAPLFKPRKVETRWHIIGDNPPEMTLYTALTEYISKTYRAAERIGGRVRINTEFAMVILQRRMASSFAALKVSLQRRRDGLLGNEEGATIDADWADAEEQAESVRWQREAQAELATPARNRQEREKEVLQLEALLDKLNAVSLSGIETKVESLLKILEEIGIVAGNAEKLLVFTEFKDTLDFLRALFEGLGYSVTQIDGSMPQALRLQAEADFRHRCQVMVATEAAGEGINLQFCAYMVNYDLPWIPTRLEQRMGRIHRYGQKRVAYIYNLVAGDTREGSVLKGLMDRLEAMRVHLGDQVYDVVSMLTSNVNLEKLMAGVATSVPTEASQDSALQVLIQATNEGAARYKQWEEHPFAITAEEFKKMRESSRQSRLTPEYAQHFFIDVLTELNETLVAVGDEHKPPGDAAVFGTTLQRLTIARELALPAHKFLRFTFLDDGEHAETAQFLALGTATFNNMLTLAHARWGETLHSGAKFIDVDLAPGSYYLLWFLLAQVRDGLGQVVDETLFAVKQTSECLVTAPAAGLIDLIPAPDTYIVPPMLREWAHSPLLVIEWSTVQQQLPFLDEVNKQRQQITTLRRDPMLADARAAVEAADVVYNELAFAFDEAINLRAVEEHREQARARERSLVQQFDHEAACSLGATKIAGVAAVFSLIDPPETDLSDERPDIARQAETLALTYEIEHGRIVQNVSGEHDDYPYDLHSSGPGGVRCIEVKGTITGQVKLSENQRRAAKRLGKSYYLYIVHDPLGKQPRLTIIRDPLSRMEYDDVLYSGARYVYNATTLNAAADEEITL